MRSFIAAELRLRAHMLGGLAAGAFTFPLIMALSYKSIGVDALGPAFDGRSPRVFTAFAGTDSVNVLSPHGWMGLAFNHPLLLTVTLTAGVSFGAGAIAGQVESGRAELLFTRPVARRTLTLAPLLAWCLAELGILTAAATGAVVGGLLASDIHDAGVARLLLAPVQLIPLAALGAAIALAASAFAATRGRAIGAAVGALVLGYLLTVVSGLLDGAEWLRWLSPFGYYSPGRAIVDGIVWWHAAVLLAAAALLVVLAIRQCERRDLA
jgi:ABC-2 type transport system permease protein